MKHAIIVIVAGSLVLLAVYLMVVGIRTASTDAPVADQVLPNATTSTVGLAEGTWRWEETVMSNGDELVPNTNVFTLSFMDEQVRITTDCNSGSGTYRLQDDRLEFGPLASTKMYCEGSQEADFFMMLRDVTSYHIADDGALILALKFDSGTMRFSPE